MKTLIAGALKQAFVTEDEHGRRVLDISAYGAASRATLRHIFLTPTPLARINALAGWIGGAVLVVVAIAAQTAASASAEDREFFPFVAGFFLVFAVVNTVLAAAATMIARARGAYRWASPTQLLLGAGDRYDRAP